MKNLFHDETLLSEMTFADGHSNRRVEVTPAACVAIRCAGTIR